MKKKYLFWLLIFALLMSTVTACGSKNQKPQNTTETSSTGAAQESTTESIEESTTEEEETSEATSEVTEESPEESTEETTQSEDEKVELLKAEYPNLFMVKVDTLNIREKAGTDGAIIGALTQYAGGEMIGEITDGWVEVKSGPVKGFIAAEYIMTGDEAYHMALTRCFEGIRIVDKIVNIRSESSTWSDVIGSAKQGEVFRKYGEENYFYEVRRHGEKAYISDAVSVEGLYIAEAVAVERIEPTEEEETESHENATPNPTTSGTNSTGNVSPQYVSAGSNGLTVCIDAGHQQHGISEKEQNGPGSSVMKAKLTTGTSGPSGIPEYIVNLQVALKLQAVLEARGYGVVQIRTTNDCPASNRERAIVANEAGADCFIRIHCNSLNDANVRGIVNYAPTASNPYMQSIPGLISNSQRLAALMGQKLSQATGAQDRGVIGGDDMTGINWCQIPVTIVEMGFMSNPEEDRLLVSSDYQDLLAEGMANAIDAYFGR